MAIGSLQAKLPLALLSVGLILTMTTSPAFAEHVQCGDVIAKDTKLDSDLTDCPGYGLVIGADHITIDLGGHVVDGDSSGLDIGIANLDGYDGTTVTNGTVQQFYDGFRVFDADQSVFRGLTIAPNSNGHAVEFIRSTRGTIADNNVLAGWEAIRLVAHSDDNRVEGNRVTGQFGIASGLTSSRNVIQRNVVRDARFGGISAADGAGDVVSKNVVTGSGRYGISLVLCSQCVVEKNFIQDNPFGLTVEFASNQSRVEKNVIRENGTGMFVRDSSDGRIEKNDLIANRFDGLTLRGDTHAVLQNTASENGDDGINVDSGQHTLTGNTTNDNGDLGIEALPGVVDGGGNRAKHNGNSAQCVGVTCK